MSIPPPEFPPPSPPAPNDERDALAAPVGASLGAASPSALRAPWSAGRRTALVVGIVAATLGILTGAVAGAVGVGSLVAQQFGGIADGADVPTATPQPTDPELRDPVTPDDLAEGAPGPLVPVQPTDCPDDCFTADILEELVPDDRLYLDADLTVVVDVLGDYDPQPVSKDIVLSERTWKDEGGEPDACFFTYLGTPIAVEIDSDVRSIDDRTWYLTTRETSDKYGVITTSARIFTDTAAASAHLSDVSRLVAGCAEYEVGTADTYWTAELSPAPALDLPPTVAAAGWVEDSPFGRFYVIDLQRGNLVVRTTLYTDGLITQEQNDTFSEKLALVLGEVDPK